MLPDELVPASHEPDPLPRAEASRTTQPLPHPKGHPAPLPHVPTDPRPEGRAGRKGVSTPSHFEVPCGVSDTAY
eukprot:6191430-Pleurochrysis_carterae.AAC.1